MTVCLVYPWKPTRDDGEELRLSLRGVDRYLHIGTVEPIVAGAACPTWYRGAFVEVPTVPGEGGPRNALRNFEAGFTAAGPGDHLMLNDDFMLLEPREDVLKVHSETWRRFRANVALWDRIESMNFYADAVRATDRWLGRYPDARSWEGHRPMWMEGGAAAKLFRSLLAAEQVPMCRSVYGNVVGYGDATVYEGPESLAVSPTSHLGTSWVAVNDVKSTKSLMKMARTRLSKPSRWER